MTELKIDKSFVHRAGALGVGLIRAMVHLARDLDLRIVAEGVETEEQRAVLLSAGCDRMQGYLFGRPVPAEEALSDLATNRIVNRLPRQGDPPRRIETLHRASSRPSSHRRRPADAAKSRRSARSWASTGRGSGSKTHSTPSGCPSGLSTRYPA